jgi:(p)ppGpp synthase/HD superfamily hydrolase
MAGKKRTTDYVPPASSSDPLDEGWEIHERQVQTGIQRLSSGKTLNNVLSSWEKEFGPTWGLNMSAVKSKQYVTTDRFSQALNWAEGMHRGSFRKDTSVPYISHLLAVSSLVMENGGDENQAIAALLHDAVEDCGGEPVLQEIQKIFGEEVASIVSECSDTVLQGGEHEMVPWKERKIAYIAAISKKSSAAILVTCADKLHNATCIVQDVRTHGDSVWERFNAEPKEIVWYYEAVVSEIEKRTNSSIYVRLREEVAVLKSLANS